MRLLVLFAALTASSVAIATALATPAAAAETLSLPRFDGVGLEGGGSVRIVPAATQRVILRSGSTAVSRIRVRHGGSLEIDTCHARCPAGYRLDVEIHTPAIDSAAVSQGGSIRIAPGFAPQGNLSVAVSRGGLIDVRAVRAGEVSAAINAGGGIEVGSPAILSAAVNAGGVVRYRGNPRVSQVVANGGSVQRAR